MDQLQLVVNLAAIPIINGTIAYNERKARLALQSAQSALVQSENLSAIGRLAAGVAHEVKNALSALEGSVGHMASIPKELMAVRAALRGKGLIQDEKELLEELEAKADTPSEPLPAPERLRRTMALQSKVALPSRVIQKLVEAGVDDAGIEAIGRLCANLSDGELPDLIAQDLKLTRELARFASHAVPAFSRIDGIVKSLLSFSKEEGGTALNDVDIEQSLEETLTLLGKFLRDRDVEIVRDFGGVGTIQAYPADLHTIFLNLIQNAAEAMENNGSEKPRLLTIRTGKDEASVTIHIEDTGPGIPAEHLPKLFEPFFTTRQGKGTGLGLSNAYAAAKKHCGQLCVENLSSGGAMFTLTLPLRAP